MKHPVLVFALLAVLLLLVGGTWLLGDRTNRDPDASVGVGPSPVAGPREADSEVGEAATRMREVEVAPSSQSSRQVETTVAWPIEVELEMVRAAGLPEAEGVPPLGTGRTARIRGRIVGAHDGGVPAVISFEAGLNVGRVIYANADGYFGATDLYPGLALVRVSGPGIPGSLREKRLVAGQETLFDLGYGLPGSVSATVYGDDGEPVEGVAVTLDGRSATTDAEGNFHFDGMASGFDLVLLLEKEGYATHYARVGVPAGRPIPLGHYKYRLQREARLRLSIPTRAGAAGPAMLVLSPADTGASLEFAWHTVSPLEVTPGSSVVVRGLPPVRTSVRVYHRGALASPQETIAILRPGREERVVVELQPAKILRGRVTGPDGLAVPEAEVRLEAPNRVAAGAMHLAKMPHVFDTAFFPPLPPAAQSTRTDRDGNYLLTAWSEQSKGRYLTATGPDGKLWAGRVVRGDDEVADLRLTPHERGEARLYLDFPERVQGLPVIVSVGGQKQPEVVLDVSELLPVEGLAPGTWRIAAKWHGQVLFPGPGHQEFDLRDEGRREVPVPPGAVHGQDPDTVLRARGD